MNNNVIFGPDTEWVSEINYKVDEGREDYFRSQIRKYFPKIDNYKLIPAYSGIRPKLFRNETQLKDFQIITKNFEKSKAVHLLGIESPGLTSSLSLAMSVADQYEA